MLAAANYLTTATGLTPDDIALYAERVWQLLTSCEERRAEELEGQSWWEYIEADRRSDEYKDYLGRTPRCSSPPIPRSRTRRPSGTSSCSCSSTSFEPGVAADRVLNGPTNDVWIGPWLEYLMTEGSDTMQAAEVTGSGATRANLGGHGQRGGQGARGEGDYYVAALPVERMAP